MSVTNNSAPSYIHAGLSRLRKLNLSHNRLSTAAAAAFATLLRKQQQDLDKDRADSGTDRAGAGGWLRHLLLNHNPEVTFEGCKALLSVQIDELIDDVVFEPPPPISEKFPRFKASLI
jgi:hypothetical protein